MGNEKRIMHRDFTSTRVNTPKVCKFPLTLEHIADKPMTFRTKGELSRYCKEKGLHSGAL